MYHSEFLLLSFAALTIGFRVEINVFCAQEFNETDFRLNSKLEFLHWLWRHGDRSPIMQMPGDPYDNSYWPDGWGQLTNLGKQQHYELGQWLRRRYDGFLPSTYNLDDMYVQSSDVDRTLQSASANMAGLYPPEKDQIWNALLKWLIVPVHTKPVEIDYLIAGQVPVSCTSYYKALAQYQQSPEMQRKLQEAKPIFDFDNFYLLALICDFNQHRFVLFKNEFAGYTATIILELRSYKDDYYVQLSYKNLNKKLVLINIPGCGTACPLPKMYEIYDKILPKNSADVECKISE